MRLTLRKSVGLAVVALTAAAGSGMARADTGPCGTNVGGPLPDLVVNGTKLAQYVAVSEEKFTSSSCAVQEGFVSGPGWKTLLRFTTSTPNIGPGALVIGNPANCPALYQYSPCHGHMHLEGYAEHRLWTPQGYDIWLSQRDLSQSSAAPVNAAVISQALKSKSLVASSKLGFCLIDSELFLASGNPTPTYTSCTGVQGLSPGWADTYPSFLDGQYIPIDQIKSGDYVLEVHINPQLILPETNTLNNTVAIRLRYTARQGNVAASVQVLP
jgi:hypothetical protein